LNALSFNARLLTVSRIRAAAANRYRPASAGNRFTQFLGGMIAICREASYPQFSPVGISSWYKIPPLGILLLLLAYLAFLLALEFIDNNIPGAQHYTSLGVRASWLAVAQIPLLLLLAGKANLIGAMIGVSYERLNVLHRWVSRGILLLITLHFGYQSYGWNLYGLMQLEWETDTCPPTGIAAYALLLWLNFTSLAPIRNRFYELFVANHILSFIAFIYLVMAHLPPTALYSRVYVYAGVGIFFLDRMIRTIRYVYHNIRPARATLTALDGDVTKIRVRSKQIKSWAPGSHVFLSIPRLGIGQSHPATIASIPSSHDGDLVFILRSRRGFTNRALKTASSSTSVYADSKNEFEAQSPTRSEKTYLALIGGPYGACHSDPAAFDTVLMISGSTGITFMLPNLLSLAHRSRTASKLPLRIVDFVWVVKQVCWTSWVKEELAEAVSTLKDKGIEVRVTIYVTCDDSFTGLPVGKATTGCACDLSLGPCCCTTQVPTAHLTEAGEAHDDNDDIVVAGKGGNTKTDQEAVATTTAMSHSSVDAVVSRKLKVLPHATFVSGRPSMQDLVWELADQAEGEMGVFACGPLGLSTAIRNAVASISDERAVHKGTGAEGIYLHAESFCW
jgi:ferric-chelate reductase